MLRYFKLAEPESLKTLRSTAGASYQSLGFDERQPLRAALVRDQGSLCAYCQQRIRATADSMEIEHWLSRAQHPDQQLSWKNMLGVCKGVTVVGGREWRHCDESRGQAALFMSPLAGRDPSPRDFLSYDAEGRIRTKDPRAEEDIKLLNLDSDADVHILRSNRANVLSELRRQLDRKGWSLGELDRRIRQCFIQAGTQAPEFAEFSLFWLSKWRERALSRRRCSA